MTTNETVQDAALTVGELAAKDYRKADVFRKYGIDFCCGGGQTLAEAARKAGIAEGELLSALQLSNLDDLRPEQDYANWSFEKLTDHIVSTHHRYIREAAP